MRHFLAIANYFSYYPDIGLVSQGWKNTGTSKNPLGAFGGSVSGVARHL